MNGITTTWKRGKRINHPPHKGTMFWPANRGTYDPFGKVAAAHKATNDYGGHVVSEWISVEDRLPDVEGEYLVAYRSVFGRGWQYLLDDWGGGDDETPSKWYSDGPGAPKVEYWLDFPRLP